MKKPSLFSTVLSLIFLYVIVNGIITGSGRVEEPDVKYSIISTSSYVRAGEECTAYRIQIDKDTPHKDLLALLNYFSRNGKDYCCIWFYSSAKDSRPFIQYEYEKPGEDPVITKY